MNSLFFSSGSPRHTAYVDSTFCYFDFWWWPVRDTIHTGCFHVAAIVMLNEAKYLRPRGRRTCSGDVGCSAPVQGAIPGVHVGVEILLPNSGRGKDDLRMGLQRSLTSTHCSTF